MNRRGFFSSLFDDGESQRGAEQFFFGAQFVMATLSDDAVPRRLRKLIAEAAVHTRPQEKFSFYKRLSAVLLEQQPFWEYGYWDYRADNAQAEFEQWTAELRATMATETDELGASADDMDTVHRISSEKYYVVVTVCFVLDDVSALAAMSSVLDSIPEDSYWSRSAFSQLLEALVRIDFEYCSHDAVFIIPGNNDDGFSWEDLHGAGWEYLKPISW
jgi:Protein of unknown function (DUF1517)